MSESDDCGWMGAHWGSSTMFYFNRRSLRNFARLRALNVHQRLSISCVVVAAALSGSVSAAHAVVECQSEKGAGYPWAWREIDGKRCWYKGKAGMDKKLLRWAESTNAPAASKASPRPDSGRDQGFGRLQAFAHAQAFARERRPRRARAPVAKLLAAVAAGRCVQRSLRRRAREETVTIVFLGIPMRRRERRR